MAFLTKLNRAVPFQQGGGVSFPCERRYTGILNKQLVISRSECIYRITNVNMVGHQSRFKYHVILILPPGHDVAPTLNQRQRRWFKVWSTTLFCPALLWGMLIISPCVHTVECEFAVATQAGTSRHYRIQSGNLSTTPSPPLSHNASWPWTQLLHAFLNFGFEADFIWFCPIRWPLPVYLIRKRTLINGLGFVCGDRAWPWPWTATVNICRSWIANLVPWGRINVFSNMAINESDFNPDEDLQLFYINHVAEIELKMRKSEWNASDSDKFIIDLINHAQCLDVSSQRNLYVFSSKHEMLAQRWFTVGPTS